MSRHESTSTVGGVGTALRADVLSAVFDQAPVGIGICDEDGRFVAVNDYLLRLFGYHRDEVLGRPFLHFVDPEHRAVSLAGYFESVVAAAGNVPSPDRHTELRCVAADGRSLLMAVTWTITRPVDHGHQYGVIHLRDVTASRQLQRDLVAAHTRIDLAFHSAPIGLAVVDQDGRLAQTNAALQRLLGVDAATLTDMTFLDITHPADREDALATFEQLLAGPHAQSRETLRRYLRGDGKTLYARRVATAAHGPDGRTAYVLLQIEDVTALGAGDPSVDGLDDRVDRDAATGLVTRDALARHVALSKGPSSLLAIEIDDVKRPGGGGVPDPDDVVAAIADRVRNQCRDGDVVARVGEAALAVLISESPPDAAPRVAQRITTALTAPLVVDGVEVTVTARVGVSTSPGDTAALRDGESGRSTPQHRHQLTASARELALQSDLHLDLRADRLRLAYQPIVRLSDGAIRSVEALARWDHPALGALSPSEFIPLAERDPALTQLLTRWSLDTACRDLAAWRAARRSATGFAVAVNISAVSLAHPDLPSEVIGSLSRFELSADDLILEITETALADADDLALANAHALAEHGLRIAIDDFGAGYSSLARLARLPVTDLKLDASLTTPTLPARAQRALITATVALAADLGMTLTAEGIETSEQADLMRSFGCDQGQGHLFGRPQPLDALDP